MNNKYTIHAIAKNTSHSYSARYEFQSEEQTRECVAEFVESAAKALEDGFYPELEGEELTELQEYFIENLFGDMIWKNTQ
jgi:hypothetical protein